MLPPLCCHAVSSFCPLRYRAARQGYFTVLGGSISPAKPQKRNKGKRGRGSDGEGDDESNDVPAGEKEVLGGSEPRRRVSQVETTPPYILKACCQRVPKAFQLVFLIVGPLAWYARGFWGALYRKSAFPPPPPPFNLTRICPHYVTNAACYHQNMTRRFFVMMVYVLILAGYCIAGEAAVESEWKKQEADHFIR